MWFVVACTQGLVVAPGSRRALKRKSADLETLNKKDTAEAVP